MTTEQQQAVSDERTTAMRQALEWYDNGNENREEFKEMIRQIIKQQPAYRAVKTVHEGKPYYVSEPERPAAEPVAYVRDGENIGYMYTQIKPAAQWVGLTDEDVDYIANEHATLQGAIRAIEAKLRAVNGFSCSATEKNGGAA